MKLILQIFIIFFASLNLLLTRFVLFPLHQPTTLVNWIIKVFVCALSPILFLVGLLTAILGIFINSLPVIIIGSLSALFYLVYIIKATRPLDASTGFEKVFGKQWEN